MANENGTSAAEASGASSAIDASAEFRAAFAAVLESGISGGTGTCALPANIHSPDVMALVQLQQLVSAHQLRAAKPASPDAQGLLLDVAQLLTAAAANQHSALHNLLQSPHIRQLLSAHDDLANRRFEPVLPEIPHEVDDDEGVAIKIVRLVRNNEPLGATIKCEQDGTVVIARVMKGGVADRSACIQVGDRVIEVNGVCVTGKQPKEIVRLLADNTKTVTFKLVPTHDQPAEYANIDEQQPCSSNRRVRTLFDYAGCDDQMHPCPEAALSFRKGDILELVDCQDAHWWQATRETDGTGPPQQQRVGLVPSKSLMDKELKFTIEERRLSQQQQQQQSECASPKGSPLSLSSKSDTLNSRNSHRLNRIMYDAHAEKPDALMLTYEDVGLLYPRNGLIRPIVLIGPPGVGRNELQRRLLLLSPDTYSCTVPHTSRPPKPGEQDGHDYWFASKSQMETWVRQGRFIEYGEYKGNIYGTLADSVERLLAGGVCPVMTPHPQALRLLRTAAIRPYIVFVKPPPFPALKESRSSLRARSTKDGSYARGFSDDELQAMLDASAHLEQQYGHTFDYVLVNGNLDFAFRELCDVLQRLRTQPAWVPQAWLT